MKIYIIIDTFENKNINVLRIKERALWLANDMNETFKKQGGYNLYASSNALRYQVEEWSMKYGKAPV